MASSVLRPGTDDLLRAWGAMVDADASGMGFGFGENRQTRFQSRATAFLDAPSRETLASL